MSLPGTAKSTMQLEEVPEVKVPPVTVEEVKTDKVDQEENINVRAAIVHMIGDMI